MKTFIRTVAVAAVTVGLAVGMVLTTITAPIWMPVWAVKEFWRLQGKERQRKAQSRRGQYARR